MTFQCQKCDADAVEADKAPEQCAVCGSDDIRELCPFCGEPFDTDTRLCVYCKEHV